MGVLRMYSLQCDTCMGVLDKGHGFPSELEVARVANRTGWSVTRNPVTGRADYKCPTCVTPEAA